MLHQEKEKLPSVEIEAAFLEGRKLAGVEVPAAFLNVPLSWVYERTRRGAIPVVRVGKYVRFNLLELQAWAKAGCPSE